MVDRSDGRARKDKRRKRSRDPDMTGAADQTIDSPSMEALARIDHPAAQRSLEKRRELRKKMPPGPERDRKEKDTRKAIDHIVESVSVMDEHVAGTHKVVVPKEMLEKIEVELGDSIWTIARRYSSEDASDKEVKKKVEEIIKVNNIPDADMIRPGHMLYVRVRVAGSAEESENHRESVNTGSEPPDVEAHKKQPGTGEKLKTILVRKGDSLWKIARNLLGKGASNQDIQEMVDEITQDNQIPDPDLIYPGQQLFLRTEDEK